MKKILAALCMVAGLAGVANAAPLRGDFDIQGGFNLNMNSSGNGGAFGIGARFGYFFTEWLEAGISQSLNYAWIDGNPYIDVNGSYRRVHDTDQLLGGTLAFVDLLYNVPAANNVIANTVGGVPYLGYIGQIVVPYVGIGLGGVYGQYSRVLNYREGDRKSSFGSGAFAPEAGLKFFFTDQMYFGIGYQYLWAWDKPGDDAFDNGFHNIVGNLGYVWGGDHRLPMAPPPPPVIQPDTACQSALEACQNKLKKDIRK